MQAIQKLTFIILILFLATAFIHAQTSQLINYQGKLTGKDGQAPSGSLVMIFSIYSDSAGTVSLWSETHKQVVVNNGLFNVLLGSVKPLSGDIFTGSGNCYLGIKVGDDPEMKPRFQLTSVAFAIRAAKADTAQIVSTEGMINAPYARPIREQMVHRRVLFGFAGDTPVSYQSDWVAVRFLYGPFGYAVPSAQPGATRKFRLYAIYSDYMTTDGENQIRFDMDDGNVILFTLGRTWGDPNLSRDGYSDWKTVPWTTPNYTHGTIKIRTNISGRPGKLFYLELQAWDFF